MSFSPGQIITAQRLNRLQPKKYWVQCSSAINPGAGSGDVPGTSQSITVETNGATASFWWSNVTYSSGAMGSTGSITRAQWDVNPSPAFNIYQSQTATEKGTNGQTWSTSIPAAGTYTFKLIYTNVTNSTIQVYTAMLVEITEVA